MPQNSPDATYDSFQVWRTRVRRNGLAMMPVAGPSPQPSVPVVLNGSSEYEVIVFAASRRGAVPVVPGPLALRYNTNRLFLGGSQSGCDPLVDFGGVMTYAVAGVYLYAIIAPEGLQSNFPLAIGPWPGLLSFEQFIPSANFDSNYQISTVTPGNLGSIGNGGDLPRAISGEG